LATKVEKHSKNKRPFISSYSWSSPQIKSHPVPKAKAISKDSKGLEKGKNVSKEFPKKLDGKTFLSAKAMGNFKLTFLARGHSPSRNGRH